MSQRVLTNEVRGVPRWVGGCRAVVTQLVTHRLGGVSESVCRPRGATSSRRRDRTGRSILDVKKPPHGTFPALASLAIIALIAWGATHPEHGHEVDPASTPADTTVPDTITPAPAAPSPTLPQVYSPAPTFIIPSPAYDGPSYTYPPDPRGPCPDPRIPNPVPPHPEGPPGPPVMSFC